MQDITSITCANTAIGFEKQLTDRRDYQTYYVGKMKDGRCWMLQNLALNLTTTGLKSSDTNITSNWDSSSTYPPQATRQNTASGSTSPSTVVQSWSYGKWVLATPLEATICEDDVDIKIGSLAGCTKVGFVDVSSSSFEPTYTATTGTWNGATVTNNTLVTVNCTTWSGSGTSKKCTAGTYDPHYLVGNYYSWNAATAGTGGTMTSGDAGGSICPKGWRLPRSDNTTATGSFDGLLRQYGVNSSVSGTVDGTTYDIAGAPLRFVRGGIVIPGSILSIPGSVGSAGWSGNYWSSTPSNSGSSRSYAYRLQFNSSVKPSNDGGRYDGQSVRCVSE